MTTPHRRNTPLVTTDGFGGHAAALPPGPQDT
jgi:hypothetical protein